MQVATVKTITIFSYLRLDAALCWSDSFECCLCSRHEIQSTLGISKSKGPSETIRDIHTSTYQMCSIEENTNGTTKFHKWTCNLTPFVRNICWKYCGNIRLSTIFCYLMLDFYVKRGIRFSRRDRRLFEITEVEITKVDCSCIPSWMYALGIGMLSNLKTFSIQMSNCMIILQG